MTTPVRLRSFFNPALCPNCGGGLGATTDNLECTWCGAVLHGPTAQHLGEVLVEADRTLDQLLQESVRTVAPTPVPQAQPAAAPPYVPFPTVATPYPPYVPVPQPQRHPRRKLDVATVLLSLGALCLVVSALVFISFHWGSMGLGAKVGVLALVTLTLSGVASFVTRRGLRASAEALWAITLIDVGIDLVAAKHARLGSLENLSWSAYLAAASAALTVVAVGVSLWTARTKVGRPLTSSQLVAGITAPAAVIWTLRCYDAADWFAESSLIVFAAAASYGAWRLGLRVAIAPLAIAGGYAWIALTGTGIVKAFEAHYATRLVHGHAPHLVLAVVLTFALAAVVSRYYARYLPALSAVAFGLLATMALAVSVDLLPTETVFAPAVLAFAVVAFVPRNGWSDGARWVFAAVMAGGALSVLASATSALNLVEHQPRIWRGAANAHIVIDHALDRSASADLVMLGALLIAAAAGSGLVRLSLERFAFAAGAISAPFAAAILMHAEPREWVAVAIFLTASAVSVGLSYAGHDRKLALAALPSLAMAHGIALATPQLTIFGFTLGGLASLAVSRLPDVRSDVRTTAELSALAHVFVVGTAITHIVWPQFERPSVVGLLAVAAIAGVVCVMSASRSWWRWISASTALLASWILASAFEHQVIEWYSLPLGAVALLFGLSAARHTQATFDSWLFYGPGLIVLTAPSLVLALQDPTSLRASLVGVWLVGLIAWGVLGNLQAPLMIGAVAGALMALVEIWPYAVAVPRWASLGVIGVLLLAVGVTWEDRRRDWTQAQRALHGMR